MKYGKLRVKSINYANRKVSSEGQGQYKIEILCLCEHLLHFCLDCVHAALQGTLVARRLLDDGSYRLFNPTDGKLTQPLS